MDKLSIVIRDTQDKIYEHIELLKPLLEDNKTHLVLINNDTDKFDLPFKYTLYEFSEEYCKFKDFYTSACLYDDIILIEKGIKLNDAIIKIIEKSIEKNINIKVKVKKYIDNNKLNYLTYEMNILLNHKTSAFENICDQYLEDFSLVFFNHKDIQVNLYKLLEAKQYKIIYKWYIKMISNKETIYKEKFFEILENYKTALKAADIEEVNRYFLMGDMDNNYKSYLILKGLYEGKEEGFEKKIKEILASNEFTEENMYFSNFIRLLFKERNYCLELIKCVNANVLVKYIKYLLESDNNFFLDMYDFIMSIDLEREISIENNEKVATIMNILSSYISCMSDKSADIKKKNILIQMFLDYTNYGLYNLNKSIKINKNLHLNDEAKFLIEIDKAINYLSKNLINEAISALRKAGEAYKLMEMPVRYYIQRLIRENNLYKYKFSICIMAKNEEKFLNKCLSSIKPLLDSSIAELIFVDTGSTDKTIEIASNYVDRIYHKIWQGNFSEIRNYCISLAQGEFIVIIDADEELEKGEAEKIIEFFSSEECLKYNTYTFKEKNFSDEEYKDFSMLSRTFIFKNREDFLYYGSIHNQPNKVNPICNLDIVALHYGYIMTDDIKDKKFHRTATLLKKEIQKDPQNLYYRMQLSTSYSMHGDNDNALEQVELYMKLLENKELTKGLNLMAYNNAALIYCSNNYYDKSIALCNKALEVEPDFIDFVFYRALGYFGLERYTEAIKDYLNYLELLKNTDKLGILGDDSYIFYSLGFENDALGKLLICYYNIGDYEGFNKIVHQIDDVTLLKYCTYTILKFYIENKKYNNVIKFFCKKVMNNEDNDLKYVFSYFILEIMNECEDEDKISLINEFDTIKDNREYIETIETLINSREDSSNLLDFINNYNLEKLDLITSKMILEKTCPLLISYDISTFTIERLKALKNSALFILNRTINTKLFRGLSKKDLLSITKNYINLCNELIIKKRYDLLTEKEIEFIDLFNLASKEFNNNRLTEGLRKIRDSVAIHEEMARPMQLYLEAIIPGFSSNLDYFCENKGEENMNNELLNYSNKIKKQIENLINANSLSEAKILIEEYNKIINEDSDIQSMKAIILIMENMLDEAENILLKLVEINKDNFDVAYNLGYLYQLKSNEDLAIKYYKIAHSLTDDHSMKEQISNLLNTLLSKKLIDNNVKAYISEGNYNKVIEYLNENALQRNYNNIICVCDYWVENVNKETPIIYYFRAIACNGLKEFDGALHYHKKALELDNSFADLKNKKSRYIYNYSEKEIDCIGCGSSEYEIVWVGNQSISEDSKELINPIRVWVRCKECGLIYSNPQPEEEVLNRYYSIIAKEKFGGIYGNIDDRFSFLVELANERLSKIEGYNEGEKTLLDIGAGIGTFVGTAIDRGWDATGLELTPEDCEYAKNKYGIQHLQKNFYSFDDDQKYDVVTLFEVIEHLQKPLQDMKKINGLVKPGGLFVLATPIVDCLYGRKMKEHNIFWNVVTHLTYFSRQTMLDYLKKAGFQVLEINMSKEQMGRVEFYCRKTKEV